MREIKFRFWDGTKGNMAMCYQNSEGSFEYSSGYTISFRQAWIEANATEGYDKPKSLMQYTGLKDKNGKDVYEGDILRVSAANDYEETTYNSFEVFWHDNDATPTDCGLVLGRLTAHGNSAGGYSGYKLIPKHVGAMEVIGNIYENPELLNPKSESEEA